MTTSSPRMSTLSYVTLNDHLLGCIATEERGEKSQKGSDSQSLRQSELKMNNGRTSTKKLSGKADV